MSAQTAIKTTNTSSKPKTGRKNLKPQATKFGSFDEAFDVIGWETNFWFNGSLRLRIPDLDMTFKAQKTWYSKKMRRHFIRVSYRAGFNGSRKPVSGSLMVIVNYSKTMKTMTPVLKLDRDDKSHQTESLLSWMRQAPADMVSIYHSYRKDAPVAGYSTKSPADCLMDWATFVITEYRQKFEVKRAS